MVPVEPVVPPHLSQTGVSVLIARVPTWLIVTAIATPVTLAIRVWWAHGTPLHPTAFDAEEFLTLAASLASSGTFSRDGAAEILRTPLYPLLLAPGFWLGVPLATALVMHLAIATTILALAFHTALKLSGSERVATMAALLYLAAPTQPIITVSVSPDLLLTLFAAWMMWLLVTFEESGQTSHRPSVMLAVAAAGAAYTKPPGYFVVILLSFSLIAGWGRTNRRRLARQVVILFAVYLAAVTPWHVRNLAVAGYGGFSSQIERAMFRAAPAALLASHTGQQFTRAHSLLAIGDAEQEAAYVRRLRESHWPVVVRSMPAYAGVHLRGSLYALFNPAIGQWATLLNIEWQPREISSTFATGNVAGALERLRASSPLTVLAALLLALWPVTCTALMVLAAYRWWVCPPIRALALFVLLWLVIVGGPFGDARYRSPAVPALAVLAAMSMAKNSSTRVRMMISTGDRAE